MNKKIHLFSILVAFTIIFVASYFSFSTNTFADPCYDSDGFEITCDCANGANNSACDCSLDGQEEVDGQCVDPCVNGQSRDLTTGQCVDAVCPNGATNPPDCDNGTCDNGAVDFDQCSTCADGEEMVDGYCDTVCPSGTTRDADGNCLCDNGSSNPPDCDQVLCEDPDACNYEEYGTCYYDCQGSGCCADNNALNFDPNCPNPPDTYEDNSGTCTYCTPGSTDPECQRGYCSDLNATNGQTQQECEASGYSCHVDDSVCTYPTLNYCDDPTATGPNTVTLAQCQANRVSPNQICSAFNTATYCDWPQGTYCGIEGSANYDENGAQCKLDNNGRDCALDNSTCYASYCSVAFAMNIECPSGFTYDTPTGVYYTYTYSSVNDPDCTTGLVITDYDYLNDYFSQLICGSGSSAVCENGVCGDIDWCPSIDGIQTDPTSCIDVCPNLEGNQLSESECSSCPTGQRFNETLGVCEVCANPDCGVTDGVCGELDGGTATTTSEITGNYECFAGDEGDVSYSNGLFSWTCGGIDGGTDAHCSADINCCPNGPPCALIYCDTKDQCVPSGGAGTCNPPNDCVNINSCAAKLSVSFNSGLNIIPPIIERGESCEIDFGNNDQGQSKLFYSFKSSTHCELYNQDGLIYAFDPKYIGNTDPVAGPIVPLVYSEDSIQKDTIFTLKCYDGGNRPTNDEDFATAVGYCRLNLKTKESN